MNIKDIELYEQRNNIYMNFSFENGKLFGLPEGNTTQYYINDTQLEKYETFLNDTLFYLEKFEAYYKMNHCFDEIKKLKKYRTYKKRLETAKKKIKKGA